MSNNVELRKDLNLSYVPRWTIVPMLRDQTVAEHSWRVALIAWDLCFRLSKDHLGPEVLVAAVMHDLTESRTGDIPSTIKSAPNFKIMAEVGLIVKIADYVEGLTWAKMWAHPSVKEDVVRHVRLRLDDAIKEMDSRNQNRPTYPAVWALVDAIS